MSMAFDAAQQTFFASCDSSMSSGDYTSLASAITTSSDWQACTLPTDELTDSCLGSIDAFDPTVCFDSWSAATLTCAQLPGNLHATASSGDANLSMTVPHIMAPLKYTSDAINAYLAMPPMQHGETVIPASYIRSQSAKFKKTWMSRTHATHQVIFTTASSSINIDQHRDDGAENAMDGNSTIEESAKIEQALYPVHEWVMASQCTAWHKCRHESMLRSTPVMRLHVEHFQSVDTLFSFLHTHDEKALYAAVQKQWNGGSLEGEKWVRGMIANIVILGIFNDKLRDVIWSVIEP